MSHAALDRWSWRWWCAALRQPSLARRLVVAALLAFALVGAVLMGRAYLNYASEVRDHPALVTACRHLGASLGHAATPDQARVLLQGAETYFNASRADFARQRQRRLEPLLLELRTAEGQRLFASAALRETRLQGRVDEATAQWIEGRPYWTCRTETARGVAFIAEPVLADLTVLSWIGRDLLPELLLAFPFVLLPVGLAMFQGLRPLRQLARQLDQRSPQDFSAIQPVVRHAELRPLMAAFNALLARLREAVQRERAFVQDAAHELRTPMAVIAAQAHVLAQAQTAEARRQAAAALEGALARASHLSSQLLTMAALDEARPPTPQPVDLAVLTQQALAGFDPVARARGLTLALDAPDHLVAPLELAAFQSVLHNLLDNALRYGAAGGTVEVTLRGTARGWALRVADDGCGIAPQDRERLFERFARGRESSHVAGTGLGLAIVRQAVTRLDGALRVGAGLAGRGVAFEVAVGGLWLP